MAVRIASCAASRRRLLVTSVALAVGASLPSGLIRANGPECVTLEVFPVQTGDHPHDVAPAADDSRVWYTAQHAETLGLLDPLTGEIERIALGEGAAPHGVIVALDGAAWVTDGGRDEIQRVDAETKKVERFPIGTTGANLNTAAFDGDGALWFTGQNGVIGRLDPESGEMTTADSPRGRGPYGICATPEGDVWFVSLAGSYLGRLHWRDGEIVTSEIDPPTAGAGLRRVWSDSRGKLWIAEWNAGQLARYEPADETWQEWRLPGDAPQAYAVYVDDVDIVWIADFGGNAIVRFDPETEEFQQYPLPHAGGNVRQLLGRTGEVWGAESGVDHLIVARTVCAGP
jgi:virginiamycin B lyase